MLVETVKQELDGEGTVVRMYECYGARTRAELRLGHLQGKAYLTNLMEQVERELPVVDGRIALEFKPYEIVTVLIK